MDRQTILDQKRQRLLELRQRRAGLSSDKSILSVGPDARTKGKVDFSVQVDLVSSIDTQLTVDGNEGVGREFGGKESFRFDKSVQTDDVIVQTDDVIVETDGITAETDGISLQTDEISHTNQKDQLLALEQINENGNLVLDVRSMVEKALEKHLDDNNLGFSDLRLGRLKINQPVSISSSPFILSSTLKDFIKREIISVCVDPCFPELVLLVYGTGTGTGTVTGTGTDIGYNTALEGLAVIYNTKSGIFVPEFFLKCCGTISVATFDKSNPTKVFAGLTNGHIVMWDLSNVKPTQIAMLPTLQSSSFISTDPSLVSLAPPVSLTSLSKKATIVYHNSPILYLGQPMWNDSHDPTFVTICSDGVVNMWSPNMLAVPKLLSIKIGAENPRIHELLLMSAFAITKFALNHLDDKPPLISLDMPEFGFLDRAVIGTLRGIVQRLHNTKDSLFLAEKLYVPQKRDTPYDSRIKFISNLNFDDQDFLLLVHSDWYLRLWNSESGKLLKLIPTSTSLNGISPRPGREYQFVTFGDFKPPNARFTVEFWDLKVRLLSPLFEFSSQKSRSGTVSFDATGDNVYVAYENGNVEKWAVDEMILQEQSKNKRKPNIDKGFVSTNEV